MKAQKNGWMEELMNRRRHRRTDGWKDWWTDEGIEERMDWWTDEGIEEQMDGRIDEQMKV